MLGIVEVHEVEGRDFDLLVDVVELVGEGLAGLLGRRLGPGHLVTSRPHVRYLSQDLSLIFLNPKLKVIHNHRTCKKAVDSDNSIVIFLIFN